MPHTLIIDFGATYIKSKVISDFDSSKNSKFVTKGSAFQGTKFRPDFFSKSLKFHVKNAKKKYKISNIIICCEMHGFLYKTGANYSDYYSWRYSTEFDTKTIKELKTEAWYQNLNIFPRPGLPITNLISMTNKNDLPKRLKILFIPQFICEDLGYSTNNVHPTLGQASGLYSNEKNLSEIVNIDVTLPKMSRNDFNLLGEIKFNQDTIPVYGGYGDLQTSLYDIKKNSWNINLGTGSQIAIITEKKLKNFEIRAGFKNKNLQCVSHIPAGRSLDLLADFFKSIREEDNVDFFWEKIKNIEFKKEYMQNKQIKIDLNFFRQNRFYSKGGFFKNITETNFNHDLFFYNIIFSMAYNFYKIIKLSKSMKDKLDINIYGSLEKKIPIFKNVLKYLTKSEVKTRNDLDDPTLINLEKIYLDNYNSL